MKDSERKKETIDICSTIIHQFPNRGFCQLLTRWARKKKMDYPKDSINTVGTTGTFFLQPWCELNVCNDYFYCQACTKIQRKMLCIIYIHNDDFYFFQYQVLLDELEKYWWGEYYFSPKPRTLTSMTSLQCINDGLVQWQLLKRQLRWSWHLSLVGARILAPVCWMIWDACTIIAVLPNIVWCDNLCEK